MKTLKAHFKGHLELVFSTSFKCTPYIINMIGRPFSFTTTLSSYSLAFMEHVVKYSRHGTLISSSDIIESKW